jgi:diphthamide biosynthesis protein 2
MEWANKLGSKRIALQFDDSQLHRSAQIAADLAKVANVYVLADSTFGSCCVDTVAAAHINCDLLIHYGPACLSKPSCHYPVVYVPITLITDF